MRTYQKSECFASIFFVGVTDTAKGKILPFGSNRNDEPFFPAVLAADSSKRTKCPLGINHNIIGIDVEPNALQILLRGQNCLLVAIVTVLLFYRVRYG